MSDKKQIMIDIQDKEIKVGMTKSILPIDAIEILNDAMHTILEGMRKQAEEMRKKIVTPHGNLTLLDNAMKIKNNLG